MQIKMESAGYFKPGRQPPECKLLAQASNRESIRQLFYVLNLKGLQTPSFVLLHLPMQGQYYISITIVESYNGKYHKFVAVCIVTSAQYEYNANGNKRVIFCPV